jgi:hypothetical protein
MLLQQFQELVLERDFSMMLFLIDDVTLDGRASGLADRECAIAGLPCEVTLGPFSWIHPDEFVLTVRSASAIEIVCGKTNSMWT